MKALNALHEGKLIMIIAIANRPCLTADVADRRFVILYRYMGSGLRVNYCCNVIVCLFHF